jgi:competence protein ComEA
MSSSWLDRNRNIVFSLLSVAAIGGATIFYLQQPEQKSIEILPVTPTATLVATATPLPPIDPTPTLLRVYVTGAVAKSDVYVLPQGSIVKDVIEAAGGLTTEADPVRINLAQELRDQQHIHVPLLGEENPPPPIQEGQVVSGQADQIDSNNIGAAAGTLINLNTATLEQLDQLPGVGPAIAQRIIDYRQTVGSFTSIEQITEVKGIGDATFEKIKPLITIE